MIKIRVFADFCEFDKTIFEKIYGRKHENLEFVDDDSFTHIIIINQAMPIIQNIPKKNVIGFAWEPIEFLKVRNEFIEYAKKYISSYFIGKKNDLPLPFKENYGFLWHNHFSTSYKEYNDKPNIMSLMVSQKRFLPGHSYRYKLAVEIIKQNLPVDIRGRGCSVLKQYFDVPQIKEEFENDEELYRDYKYTIAIENTQSNKYISEKITNTFVHNTIPLYLGAKDVDEIFGKDCCIKLTGELEKDIEIIKNILNSPDEYKRDMKIYRNRLFNGNGCLYNFLKKIWL